MIHPTRPIKLNGGPLDGLQMLVPPDTDYIRLNGPEAFQWEPSAVASVDDTGTESEVWSLVDLTIGGREA